MDKQENIQVQQQSQQQINIQLSSFLKKNNILLGKKLGEGNFAEVFEGFDINLNQKVAIKKLTDLTNLKKFEDEKNAMQKIQNHQYAVQIIKYLNDVELADLGLSQLIQNPELQQLISVFLILFLIESHFLSQKQSKQQNGGNLKYMAPEVTYNIKPFTIKIDVFSIGQILLEFLLKRELTLAEFLKLKENNLFKIIPQLSQHQNYEFVQKILEKMLCHQSDNRLESITLLQRLNQFKIDEGSLKSLQFTSNNTQKMNQSSQKQLPINKNTELCQQLVAIPSKDIVIDKKNSKNSQNLQLAIQLSSINLIEKKEIKSICITNQNMNQKLNLKNYQEKFSITLEKLLLLCKLKHSKCNQKNLKYKGHQHFDSRFERKQNEPRQSIKYCTQLDEVPKTIFFKNK
ncbi:hypothetical protein ABPG72_020361, partial [Tetrahymena utriculariae]